MLNTKTKLPSFITERDLSQFLGISLRTIQGWRARGEGPPYIKIGGSVRYELTRLKEYLDAEERLSISSNRGDRK